MEKPAKRLTRRDMVKNVTLLGLAGTVSPLTTFANTSRRKGVPAAAENSKPGTLE